MFAGNRLRKKTIARAASVVTVLAGLSAPALANHFNWAGYFDGSNTDAVTAESAHVTCPEGMDQATCDEEVASVAQELSDSEHPENHGKYVSFVAHCLKGMQGKGKVMSQIAQAGEDEQMETAVRLCSEYRLSKSQEQSQVSGDESSATEGEDDSDHGKSQGHGKGKGKGHNK